MVAIVKALKRVTREYKVRLTPNAILQICDHVGHQHIACSIHMDPQRRPTDGLGRR